MIITDINLDTRCVPSSERDTTNTADIGLNIRETDGNSDCWLLVH